MDLKIKRINWMGSIYHKFEAVCQEVDDIVGQDAVKYLENRVQNVGDSVKKFYSDVVQDLLPLPALVNSAKSEDHSVPLENNIGSSVKAAADVEDINNNKKGDEENPVNNFIESLLDSNAIVHAEDHQALASIENHRLNQVNYENYSDSLEVEDSYITKEVVDDDHSRETSGAEKENLDASTEMMAVQSPPQPMNLISFKQEGPLQFSICSESCSGSGSSNSGCGVSVREKDKLDVNVEQNACSIVEKNATDLSTSQVLNFKSLGEKESLEASLISELSDVFDQDIPGVLAEVSPAASAMSSERPTAKREPLCCKSSLVSDSLYSKSHESYSFEIGSCKNNLGDVSWCFSDGSMVHVCCESSPPVAGQFMESQDGLVSSRHSQTMESNDELLVSDIESSLEDIQLNDDAQLEESCVFVDDTELYAVSCRAQKLRSYKKRIRDAFASKKRLVKEYEQLAIWYGDTDMEPSQASSRMLLPFSSRTYVDSKNLQGQHASETEWELL